MHDTQCADADPLHCLLNDLSVFFLVYLRPLTNVLSIKYRNDLRIICS